MDKSVTLSVNDNLLKVILTKTSPFLSGMHRIFIANVLGLKEAEDYSGYFLEKSRTNISDLIIELIEYFKEEKAIIAFDGEIGETVKAFEIDSKDFSEAQIAGLDLRKKPPTTINVPNFKRKLKPYQVASVAHMVKVGNAANFSVPGSGKTTIALANYSILKNQGILNKIMVIGPRAAFMPWEEEYRACFGYMPNSVRITGPIQLRRALFKKAEESELILLSYQMASQDINRIATFLQTHQTMLVLDESHYIKRIEGGKWANALLSIAPFAKRRIILTGTPVPNSLEDLWSQMTFLWPISKILGNVDEYKDRITTNGNHAADNIKITLQPFYWRIHKSQLKLKRPKFHRISVKMRPYQKAIYDTLAVKVLLAPEIPTH